MVHNMVHKMTLENTSQYVGLERPMTFFTLGRTLGIAVFAAEPKIQGPVNYRDRCGSGTQKRARWPTFPVRRSGKLHDRSFVTLHRWDRTKPARSIMMQNRTSR